MHSTLTKRISALTLLAAIAFGSTACSSGASTNEPATPAAEVTTDAPQPVDLAGEWKQTNSKSADSFQTATITGDTIEVYWVATDTKSLYWAGTVVAPADASQSFTWDSANDTTKTGSSMMASGDATKTFTYENGELSYEVTALGTTMTVRLERE
ncbi:MAG TPA: hypothetical protein VNJ54_17865 [Plantibacter sp.]|uniref:hypothetical protein n=1 Tax=unclassified Plantibacter TaxID=2624265 RepID=UPI002C53CE50|nr:hypothetical protein [Plantibacter sp.]